MNAMVLSSALSADAASHTPAATAYLDPLDPDRATDAPVVTTRRGLTRLALVAAETGARFQREATPHDPMAWLLAPRRLFAGAAAVEACLERDHCLRAILLHGLALGLDASPTTIDALIADGPADDPDEPWPGERRGSPDGIPGGRRVRLYSAVIVVARGGELLNAFHASVAPSAAVVRERIRARLGSAAAAHATIRVGVDPDCPTTIGMVPPALLHTLMRGGRRGRWSLAGGIDVTVEQRLPS
jgi:hypothetical protein